MEYINKIELQGVVGSVNRITVGDSCNTKFSLCVQMAGKTPQGDTLIENTWFHCSIWDATQANLIDKGTFVHCIGRLKQVRYIDSDGTDRATYEVVCNTLRILRIDPSELTD